MEPEKASSRVTANICYAIGTCLVAGAGLYVWAGSNRMLHEPPAPPVVVSTQRPSIDEALREVEIPLPPAKPAMTHPAYRHVSVAGHSPAKAAVKPRSVRGGITIVGRNGTTSTVAPATTNDRTARPEYSAPTFAQASGELVQPPAPKGPRLYVSEAAAPAPADSSPSGSLHFYNFDERIPDAIQRLNRGENYDGKWNKRVTVRPIN